MKVLTVRAPLVGSLLSYLYSCKRKVKYGSQVTAKKAARHMEAKGVAGLEAYKCRYGDHWHIGHGRG